MTLPVPIESAGPAPRVKSDLTSSKQRIVYGRLIRQRPGLPARVDGDGRVAGGRGAAVATAITRDRLVRHCALFDAWIG